VLRPDLPVIVTGGSSGLGAAVATALADVGAIPVVLDVRAPTGVHRFERVDLADSKEAEEAVRRITEEHGGLSAVVTCAGIDVPGPFLDVPTETWERIVAVNLL
jgi:NAD(P)-dependent dehydrogenase (short-subunit alcohol dehydrogenase family)